MVIIYVSFLKTNDPTKKTSEISIIRIFKPEKKPGNFGYWLHEKLPKNDLILALQIPKFLKSWVVLGGFLRYFYGVHLPMSWPQAWQSSLVLKGRICTLQSSLLLQIYKPVLKKICHLGPWNTPRKTNMSPKKGLFPTIDFQGISLVFRVVSHPGICEAPKQVHQLRCQSSRCLAQSAEGCVVSDDVGTLRTCLDIHQQTSPGFYLMVGLGSNKGTMKWRQFSNEVCQIIIINPTSRTPNVHEMNAGHHW